MKSCGDKLTQWAKADQRRPNQNFPTRIKKSREKIRRKKKKKKMKRKRKRKEREEEIEERRKSPLISRSLVTVMKLK